MKEFLLGWTGQVLVDRFGEGPVVVGAFLAVMVAASIIRQVIKRSAHG